MKKTLFLVLGFVLAGGLSFYAGFRVGLLQEAGPAEGKERAESKENLPSGTEDNPVAAQTVPAAQLVPPDDSLKLVRVATITGETANEEFRRNVQLMQLKKQRVEQLQRQRLAAEGTVEAPRIGLELEKASADLLENNRRMVEIYGFSLDRDYVYVIEDSTLMMRVSPDSVVPSN